MKRIICLLAAIAILLCGCGGELPSFVKDVDDLADFRCYLIHGGDSVILQDDDAKEAYHLITDALRDMEDTATAPDGAQISMFFYVGDSNPYTDIVPLDKQYGSYSVAENGVGLYVASASASAGFNYQVDPSIFTAFHEMIK